MTKAKKWGYVNLAMALLLIIMIVLTFTYEIAARERYIESIADEEQKRGEGLASIFIIIFMVFAAIAYGVCAVLIGISAIGLLTKGKKGFAITGIVGKILGIIGFGLMFFLTVSTFSKILYALLGLAYCIGGFIEIKHCKEL